MAHLPPSATNLADHSPLESNDFSESSSPTRMEDDGHEEDVQKNEELFKKYTPCVNMDFESEEAAFEFYNEYGRITGFSVRKACITKSKIDKVVIGRKLVCNKEGQRRKDKRYLVVENPKKETRTNCLAMIYISLNRETSKWVDTSLGCKVKQSSEWEGKFNYVIGFHTKDVDYVVNGSVELDESGNTICQNICCTCRKFESFGILCSHAIKGLDRMGVMKIPESYILERWRLNVKDCELEKGKSKVDENDPKLLKAARFRIICPKMVKLATRSCELQEAYEYVEENLTIMCAKVATMFLGEGAGGSIEVETKEGENVDPQFAQVKGLKKKNDIQIKGSRRLKPWFEKKSKKMRKIVSQSRKRKKVVSQSTRLSEHIDHVATTTIVNGSFLKEPPVEIPYIPQMMSCDDSWRSIPSSSQVSYDPQTFKEMPFDLTSHSSKETNSFLDEDSFLEILRHYPGYSKQN